MCEVINFRKERNYKKKKMLLINDHADIYSSKGSINYAKYWNLKLDELNELLSIMIEDSYVSEMKLIRQIRNEIVTFIREDLSFTLARQLEEFQNKQYLPLLLKIAGLQDNVKVPNDSTLNNLVDLNLKNIIKQKKISVCISYNWSNSDHANYIYSLLSAYNFILDMDIYVIQYMDDLVSYLEKN